jgi:tetratricopeptide (TPR) repeat protein
MKKVIMFSLFAAAVLLFTNCGGVSKMVDNANLVKYTVTPSPLETHAGKVAVAVEVKYPEKYFHKKAIVTATPYLEYEGGKTDLKSETLQGEAVAENFKVISYTSGGTLSYSDELEYKPEMMRSELYVRGEASVGKAKVDLPATKIADGIVTTPLLVSKEGRPIMFNDNFKRITPDSYQADIHYVINKSDVRATELKQDDVKGMTDFLAKTGTDERIDLKNIAVSAYASPDGPEDLNTELSGDRQGTASGFIKKTMQQAKLEVPADQEFFKLMATPEDWDGFRKLMEASQIKDKDLILRVLAMYSDPVVREKEIRNISAAFEEIKTDILPQLRRSMMTVNVEKVGYSDEELKELVNTNIDTLNLEELLYAATLVDDLNRKLAVYEKSAEKFPQCIRAHNNVGYVQVKLGNAAAAKAAFEKAKALKDVNIVNNNLGVVAMMEGDFTKAEELFTSALGAGDEVNYNLGILKLMAGDYEGAQNYYGSTASFNSALTKLLNGNNSACYNMLRDLEEEDAKIYYLMAVSMAREGDVEKMYNALSTCVAKDAKWKEYAMKDVEFFKYWEEQMFKDTVK